MTKTEMLKKLAEAKRQIGILQYWLRHNKGGLGERTANELGLYRHKASEVVGIVGTVEDDLQGRLGTRIRANVNARRAQ